jgi:hypothetical protein
VSIALLLCVIGHQVLRQTILPNGFLMIQRLQPVLLQVAAQRCPWAMASLMGCKSWAVSEDATSGVVPIRNTGRNRDSYPGHVTCQRNSNYTKSSREICVRL